MLQSPFLQLPRVGIDKRNLLEAQVRIENPDRNDYGASLGWHGFFN